MRWIAACIAALAIGCDDPAGAWVLTAEGEAELTLDATNFERLGEASAVFTVPEGETAGAFYRVDATFVRMGAIEESERVFLRGSPRFESFDGTSEVTTFLTEDEELGTAGQLVLQGSLTACDEPGPCTRGVGLFAGWLAPPRAGATLDLSIVFTVELRGPGEEPPTGAETTATLTF